MAPTPHRTRHRPNLSLDSSLFSRDQDSLGFDNLAAYQAKGSKSLASTPGGLRRTPAFSASFAKVRGSIYGGSPVTSIPDELRTGRHSQASEEGYRKAPIASSAHTRGASTAKSLFDSPRSRHGPPLESINDEGPLVERHTDNGAKLTLTLDRHIQYRASPAATAAWTFHEFVSDPADPFRDATTVTASHPPELSPGSRSFPDHNPFSDQREVLAVPRVLMSFTLDLEPYISLKSGVAHENFEFVSLHLDFWTASRLSSAQKQDQPSYDTPGANDRITPSTETPIVRGFACKELGATGFLQKFGPVLYKDLHERKGSPSTIVLGSGSERESYKAFEKHMGSIGRPTVIDSDKVTARGCQDMTSVLHTPASTAFRSSSSAAGAPSPLSTFFGTTSFGTSSIRIMVKRETLQESAWSRRKFPLIILLEHPPCAAAIEARVRLDYTTVRKTILPRSVSQSQPSDFRQRDSWLRQNGAELDGTTSQRLSSANVEHKRQFSNKIALARSLSISSARSSSSTGADALEQLITIFPRKDPMSVISCGAGTVKDTLFKSGMVTHPVWPPIVRGGTMKSEASARDTVNTSMDRHARAPSMTGTTSSKSGPAPPKLGHSHTKSAQITPGMYKRSGSFGSVTSSGSEQSRVSSEGSVYSQPSAPRSHFGRKHQYSMSLWQPRLASERSPSPPEEARVPRGLPDTPINQAHAPKQTPEDDTDEMFDLVLTNWTDRMMDREESVPLPGITYISAPRAERTPDETAIQRGIRGPAMAWASSAYPVIDVCAIEIITILPHREGPSRFTEL